MKVKTTLGGWSVTYLAKNVLLFSFATKEKHPWARDFGSTSDKTSISLMDSDSPDPPVVDVDDLPALDEGNYYIHEVFSGTRYKLCVLVLPVKLIL